MAQEALSRALVTPGRGSAGMSNSGRPAPKYAIAAQLARSGAPVLAPSNLVGPPPLRSGDLRPIPASQVFGFHAILAVPGRTAHIGAVRQRYGSLASTRGERLNRGFSSSPSIPSSVSTSRGCHAA